MIPSEQDNGLHLNAHGEMGNTAFALSTVDGRFFFVTDDTQTIRWSLIEIEDAERASINANEVQDMVLGASDCRWWALEINHGSYATFADAYAKALRVMDGGVA